MESTDSSNVEKPPYYAYMLKKNTKKLKATPADDCELFVFAENPDWKDALFSEMELERISEVRRQLTGQKWHLIIGWLNHYGIASMKNTMAEWNGWLRRRIRMYIWKQWKNPRTRVQNLIKLGMEPWKAYRNGNTRKGYRAVAHSGILQNTITDKRLAQAGYFDILAKYESLHT